mmetsp:Transcript_56/g.115  ORF Transcript_56/g.115 Transcript_56/m.115 type:complete len:143 (-) Transcript_56:29-457(-)
MDCLKEAVAYLEGTVVEGEESPKLGVLGWCLGGMFSLELAFTVPSAIRACVIYYGKLETDEEKLQAIQAPILGIFGGADHGIPVESVRAFEAALERLDISHSIHIYEGAQHAFCNPTGNMYQEGAARDAWNKTLDFLNLHLK